MTRTLPGRSVKNILPSGAKTIDQTTSKFAATVSTRNFGVSVGGGKLLSTEPAQATFAKNRLEKIIRAKNDFNFNIKFCLSKSVLSFLRCAVAFE